MTAVAYLSVIMTNATIVVKICPALIFPGISRKESARHLKKTIHLEYLVYTCPASFEIQKGGCMITVYWSPRCRFSCSIFDSLQRFWRCYCETASKGKENAFRSYLPTAPCSGMNNAPVFEQIKRLSWSLLSLPLSLSLSSSSLSYTWAWFNTGDYKLPPTCAAIFNHRYSQVLLLQHCALTSLLFTRPSLWTEYFPLV